MNKKSYDRLTPQDHKSEKSGFVKIYVDGACENNQHRTNTGGWGYVIERSGNVIKEDCGGEQNTTNQRMELKSCVQALKQLHGFSVRVDLYSDSGYVVNCFHDRWYEKWQANGRRTAKKRPVANQDLWIELKELVDQNDVTFSKVDGHSGNEWNDRADELAHRAIAELE